jgi:catechol 2,3-dioxygenase-like lactoylglutathione lyase family enzyme
MSYEKRSYVEHAAIRVRDIEWHIRFFREALGMTLREVEGDPQNPRQVWTVGGVQLIHDPAFAGPEGRLGHLGIFTEDLEAALAAACAGGAQPLPQGRNWLSLPDGLVLEIMQAKNDAVERALAVNPR